MKDIHLRLLIYVFSGKERREDTFINVCPTFRKVGRGQRAFLIFLSFQFHRVLHNYYVEMA